MQINNGYDFVNFGISIIAMIFQTYTFFVVLFKSPPAMKEYKYFLCFYTFCDFCFNFTMGFIIAPKFLCPAPGFVIRGLGGNLADIFGYNALRVSFSFLVFCTAYVVQVQDYCLLYRFAVIRGNLKLQQFMTSKHGIFAFQLNGFVSALILSTLVYFCITSPETIIIFEKNSRKEIQLYADGDWKYIFLDYTNKNTYYFWGFIVGLFALSEFVSFFVLFNIYKVLSANADKFSKKTFKLQQQLIRVLTIQVINPIIFIVLPLTAGICCYIMSIHVGNLPVEIGMAIFTVYPCCNAVITIIFITPYWEFTLQWLQMITCIRCKKQSSETVIRITVISTEIMTAP